MVLTGVEGEEWVEKGAGEWFEMVVWVEELKGDEEEALEEVGEALAEVVVGVDDEEDKDDE